MSYNRPHTFGFTGFQLPKRNTDNSKVFNAVPPPPSDAHRRGPSGGSGVQMGPPGSLNKQGYATMQAISHTALSANLGVSRKRATTEEEYFDEVEEETPALAYIPAPGSPSYVPPSDQGRYGDQSDSDEDPLDAFMAGIEKQVKTETVAPAQVKGQAKKGVRDDIDEEDVEESYYRYMEENPLAGTLDEGSDGEAIEYDEDGNPIAPPRKRHIDPLMPIDHSEMDYKPFDKNFYTPHEDIQALLPHQVAELRQALGIKVTGPSPPHPVSSFAHFGFDEPLMKAIRKAEYTQPSPIQAQAVPTALSGRDIIGIAKTGSGKTAAFIWPMLVHIMDQREISPGDGPIAVILAPTRELSVQIYNEARKFGRVYNIQVVCCYGGGSKWEQSKALEGGAEVVVATPGRMIDLVKMKATNLARVTYLVLDEADRMFDMGFEPQVRSICNHVRPDRQTLLFSATFKKRIERLVRDALTDPVRIVQGELGEANDDVTQIVKIFNSPVHKWAWLISMMVQLLSEGSVLVFVTKKADAEQVANNLILKEQECLLLHGDMDQSERNKVITQFKKKEVPVLVATDVAARGLDIPHIKNVVNYDIARDIDTHTHRIGRTGRAGEQGTAYTLLTDKDKEFAGHLVRNLEGANQEVPQPLLDLALQSSWFRKSRFKNTKGKTLNIGGSGLGFKERPGLGSMDANNIDHSKAAASSAQESVPRVSKGPATDRLSAMREAFKSQYSNQFKASSDHSWEQIMQPHSSMPPPPGPPPSMPPPPCPRDQMGSKDNRKGKRSRWE